MAAAAGFGLEVDEDQSTLATRRCGLENGQ